MFTVDATRYWSKLLQNPRSKLQGFDSFEGLPQDWLPHRPRGYFSLHGEIPPVDDGCVQFFKGWFEQTLPYWDEVEGGRCDPNSGSRYVSADFLEAIKLFHISLALQPCFRCNVSFEGASLSRVQRRRNYNVAQIPSLGQRFSK